MLHEVTRGEKFESRPSKFRDEGQFALILLSRLSECSPREPRGRHAPTTSEHDLTLCRRSNVPPANSDGRGQMVRLAQVPTLDAHGQSRPNFSSHDGLNWRPHL